MSPYCSRCVPAPSPSNSPSTPHTPLCEAENTGHQIGRIQGVFFSFSACFCRTAEMSDSCLADAALSRRHTTSRPHRVHCTNRTAAVSIAHVPTTRTPMTTAATPPTLSSFPIVRFHGFFFIAVPARPMSTTVPMRRLPPPSTASPCCRRRSLPKFRQ